MSNDYCHRHCQRESKRWQAPGLGRCRTAASAVMGLSSFHTAAAAGADVVCLHLLLLLLAPWGSLQQAVGAQLGLCVASSSSSKHGVR